MLLQRLLANPQFRPRHKDLASAHAIDVQNVADWLWASEQEYWGHEDVPCLAPPFPKVWIEWGRPPVVVMRDHEGAPMTPSSATDPALFWFPSRVGCLGTATQIPDGWRWNFLLVVQFPIAASPCTSEFTLETDPQGTITTGRYRIQTVGYANTQFALYVTGIMRMPALLGIAFMHCKNVQMVRYPEADTTPKQVRRGLPMVRFSRIVVTPFRAAARRASGDAGVSLHRALHICRGHFKDYRKSGLFGRTPGIFWWDTHVRGSAEAGVVMSSHEVRQPVGHQEGGVAACR